MGILFFRLAPVPSTPTVHIESPQGQPHLYHNTAPPISSFTTWDISQHRPAWAANYIYTPRWVSGFQSPKPPKDRLTLHPTSFILLLSTGCWRFSNPYRTEVFLGAGFSWKTCRFHSKTSLSQFLQETVTLCYLAQKLEISFFPTHNLGTSSCTSWSSTLETLCSRFPPSPPKLSASFVPFPVLVSVPWSY